MTTDEQPYQQIARAVRAEIKEGRFRPGEKLPTYVELGKRYGRGAAPMTVQRALRLLRDEGLLYIQQGRGAFVRDELPAPEADVAEQIMQRLDAMDARMRDLSERLDQIEGDAGRA